MSKFEKLPNPLTIVEDTETRKLSLATERCDGIVPCHLFLVTLARRIESNEIPLIPVVTLHYVIAPDEKEAISQCEQSAFPEEAGHLSDDEMKERGMLPASAVRIPFLIRGWSRHTF